jgi:hypothetical protein
MEFDERMFDWLRADITDIKRDISSIYEKMDVVAKELSTQQGKLARELTDYQLAQKTECAEMHKPINEKLSAIETMEHAAEQVAQKEQGWGSKWNVYLIPVGFIITITIALVAMFKH